MAPGRSRLLLLSPLPPPMGGISLWTQAVLASPLARRFELRVVDTSPGGAGVAGTSRLRLGRVVGAAAILARLARELVRFRPRIVHVNTSYFWAFLRDGLALWIAGAFGARTLLHLRGGDFPEFARNARPLLRRFVEATLRRADRVVALDRHTRAYLESVVPAARVRQLPNFVRLEEIGEPPDRSGRSGPVEVLFVGWILEAKGVRELLEAARRLPEARFTLVGPEESAFAASLRAELDALHGRVRLLPPQPRAEVARLYREADIFVLPTWREGFPNVVIEAMAAGLPVVATPVGAIPEAVRDGEDGLLVPVRDADALTGALARLVADPALRRALGARARARAVATFSYDVVLARLESTWAELLEAR